MKTHECLGSIGSLVSFLSILLTLQYGRAIPPFLRDIHFGVDYASSKDQALEAKPSCPASGALALRGIA
jgi:hypothetical protein